MKATRSLSYQSLRNLLYYYSASGIGNFKKKKGLCLVFRLKFPNSINGTHKKEETKSIFKII